LKSMIPKRYSQISPSPAAELNLNIHRIPPFGYLVITQPTQRHSPKSCSIRTHAPLSKIAQNTQFRLSLLLIGEIDLQPAIAESCHLPAWLRASDVAVPGQVGSICELTLDGPRSCSGLRLDSRFSLDPLPLILPLKCGSQSIFDKYAQPPILP
jgi:hypothetical protein